MRINIGGVVAGLIAALAFSPAAFAAEIKVVTVGALTVALRSLEADYKAASGNSIAFTFTNPANLPMVLANGSFDAVLVATQTVGELEQQGKLVAGSRARTARTGIGIAIKEGASKPDVANVDAFKRYMTGVRNVLVTDPSTTTGSGVLTVAILAEAGLTEVVRAKSLQTNLAGGKERIAKGEYDMALFNLSEIEAPGVVVGGAVPVPLQRYTNYDGAVFATSEVKDASLGFLRFLASPAATAKWKAAWMEQVSN